MSQGCTFLRQVNIEFTRIADLISKTIVLNILSSYKLYVHVRNNHNITYPLTHTLLGFLGQFFFRHRLRGALLDGLNRTSEPFPCRDEPPATREDEHSPDDEYGIVHVWRSSC